jgi:hypothetical protein
MGNCCCGSSSGTDPNDKMKAKESEDRLDQILEEIKQARKKQKVV